MSARPRFLLLLLPALLAAAGLYLLPADFASAPTPGALRQSSRVVLTSKILRLALPFQAGALFVATPGAAVRAGERLLLLDTSAEEASLGQVEREFRELAGELPAPWAELSAVFLYYWGLESEEEAAPSTAPGGDSPDPAAPPPASGPTRAELEAATDARAALALELRRLELKKNRSAAEEERLRALRREEALAGEKIRAAYAGQEEEARLRAEREKTAAGLAAARRARLSAPPDIEARFQRLEHLFRRATELKKHISRAEILAPRDGLLLSLPLPADRSADRSADSSAAPGLSRDIYLLPAEEGGGLTLNAWFRPDLAASLAPGSPCRLLVGDISLPARISARLPYLPTAPDAPLPFQVFAPLPAPPAAPTKLDLGQELKILLD